VGLLRRFLGTRKARAAASIDAAKCDPMRAPPWASLPLVFGLQTLRRAPVLLSLICPVMVRIQYEVFRRVQSACTQFSATPFIAARGFVSCSATRHRSGGRPVAKDGPPWVRSALLCSPPARSPGLGAVCLPADYYPRGRSAGGSASTARPRPTFRRASRRSSERFARAAGVVENKPVARIARGNDGKCPAGHAKVTTCCSALLSIRQHAAVQESSLQAARSCRHLAIGTLTPTRSRPANSLRAKTVPELSPTPSISPPASTTAQLGVASTQNLLARRPGKLPADDDRYPLHRAVRGEPRRIVAWQHHLYRATARDRSTLSSPATNVLAVTGDERLRRFDVPT